MKQIILFFLIVFTSLGGNSQNFYNLIVTGKVRDMNNGMPVVNHAVNINSDTTYFAPFVYYAQVMTDNHGVYIDTIQINYMINLGLKISTYDCMNQLYDTNVIFNQYYAVVIADFYICDSTVTGNCQSLFGNYPNLMLLFSKQFVDYSYGTIDFRFWNFGDGTISQNQEHPIHVYQSPGIYNVCLTVYDSVNCQDTWCDTVIVDSMPGQCEAAFSFYLDTLINTPNYFHFKDISFGTNIVSWSWNFGDGHHSSQKNPDHQYLAGGTYQVCLEIISLNIYSGVSCYDSVCKTITVSNPAYYNLGGQVFAGNYPIEEGISYLYYKVGSVVLPFDTAYFDTLGYYYFYQIPQSNYIIKVEPAQNDPSYGQYFPTYYGNILFWEQTSALNLNGNTYNAGLNLKPIPGATAGVGIINGKVIRFEIDPPWDTKPVPYADVMLLDINHNPLDYTKSDAAGNFSFSGLAFNSYYLTADVTGKYVPAKLVVLSLANPIADTAYLVVNDNVLSIGDNNPSASVFMYVFPNPVTDMMNLIFSSSEKGEYRIQILNLLEQEVYHDNFVYHEGKSFIQMDVENLHSGIYLLSIHSVGGKSGKVLKFIKR